MDKTLYLLLMIRAVSTQTNDKCVLNTGKTGDCIDIKICPSLRGLLENEKQSPTVIAYLQTSICGFNGLHPKVCCPIDTSPSTRIHFQNDSTTWTTTTKGGLVPRQPWAVSTNAPLQTSKPIMSCPCVLIQFCPSVRALLKKHRGNVLVKSYIVDLICGYDDRYAKVYCPSFADQTSNNVTSNCVENINATKYIFGFTTSPKKPSFTSTTPQPVSTLNNTVVNAKVLGLDLPPIVKVKTSPLNDLCGRTTIVRDRVVGREIPSLDDWPWLAALGYKIVSKPNSPIRWLCTGSLIAENFVLTAAHCTKQSGENKLSVVRLGDLNLDGNVSDGASPQDVPIAKIIVHESFNIDNYTNDIALLKLEILITFKDNIKPICLPISPVMKSNTYVKYTPNIAGWDSTPSSQISNTAMIEVSAPIIDVATCKSILKNESVVVDNSVFCAGYLAGGNDSCLHAMRASQFGFLIGLVVLSCRTGYAFTEINNHKQAMIYLATYGYLNGELPYYPKLVHSLTMQMFKDALIEFQLFVDINPTGILDEATLRVMNSQRCGCHDKFYRAKGGRPKRFVRLLDGWRTNNLKYKISRYPTKELNKTQTDAEIKRAFDQWSEVTPLKFIQTTTGLVEINIAFQANYHGDVSPFDGVLGIFAHTLTPNRSNVHFDDSEIWTTGTKRGTNLYQVALHEFGHMLGLDHTKVKFAVMRPIYPGYNPNYKLKNDDIEGIQELYGENDSTRRNDKARTKRQTNSDSNNYKKGPDLCDNSKLDTVFSSSEGHTFVLKGDYHWKLINKNAELGYPKLIAEQWIGLPGNIDAAFTHTNGHTYFFKGSSYWTFNGTTPGRGYPRDIASEFAGIPNNINAATAWRDDKILFFKGAKYWMYDSIRNLSAHPKSTSDWKSIPESIDAALRTTQNSTYIFKDYYYYMFNDNSSLIDTFSTPAFRRKISTIWFNCKPLPSKTDGIKWEMKPF